MCHRPALAALPWPLLAAAALGCGPTGAAQAPVQAPTQAQTQTQTQIQTREQTQEQAPTLVPAGPELPAPGAAALGARRFGVETAPSSGRDPADDVRRRAPAPPRIRLGLGDAVELQVEDRGRARGKTPDDASLPRRSHGFSDLAFGATWRVRGGDAGRLPGVAWLADIEAADGATAARGAGRRPSVRVSAEWALPHDFSVGVMPGVFLDRNAGGKRFGAGILALTLGRAWTPRWNTFIEVAGARIAAARNGGSSVTLDTGLAFHATNALQFDLALARSLSRAAPELGGGLRLSARF